MNISAIILKIWKFLHTQISTALFLFNKITTCIDVSVLDNHFLVCPNYKSATILFIS